MWGGILGAALCCYLLKLGGLSLPASLLDNERVRRLSAVLPVALLAALAASQTLVRGDGDGLSLALDARLAGVLVAVLAIRFRAPFLVVIALAAVTTAGLRQLG